MELEYGRTIDNPSPDTVREVIHGLHFPDDKFAILELTGNDFIQAHLLDDGNFSVEFQEASITRHYRAPYPPDADEVVAAFLSYLNRDNRWRTQFEWTRMWLPQARRDHVVTVTDASYRTEVEASDIPVLLGFWAADDATSTALLPVLEQVHRERGRSVTVATVEVRANPVVALTWGVHRLPTMVIVRAGVLHQVLSGVRPAARLVQELDECLGPWPPEKD
jgi:thioredoxin 1